MQSMKNFTDLKDKEKKEDLRKLYDAWEKVISSKDPIFFPDFGKYFDAITYFNEDGFYPGYFSTSPRILFIGREATGCGNDNGVPIDRTITKYEDWDEELKGNRFWRRILSLVYGIKNEGRCKFEDLPPANEILKGMADNNNYGFALINISKYSNDKKDKSADYVLINRFLKDSELEKRNFIREEIELLEPDIIITANLWNSRINKKYLNMIFPKNNFFKPDDKDEAACMWDFNLNNNIIKLVETYHFSARYKDDKKHFYDPVMKLLFK